MGGESVQFAIESDLTFGKVTTTASVSNSIAKEASQSVSHYNETTFEVDCPADTKHWLTVWQWVTTLAHPENGESSDVIFNPHLCLYGKTGAEVPQCPLGYCKDKACQKCTRRWS